MAGVDEVVSVLVGPDVRMREFPRSILWHFALSRESKSGPMLRSGIMWWGMSDALRWVLSNQMAVHDVEYATVLRRERRDGDNTRPRPLAGSRTNSLLETRNSTIGAVGSGRWRREEDERRKTTRTSW